METASRVMYSIANFFTWIIALLSLTGIVFSALQGAHVLPDSWNLQNLGWGTMTWFIILFLVSIITISLVRIAKNKNSSKGWDVLFLVLGIIGGNIFYILGGIFGIVAIR